MRNKYTIEFEEYAIKHAKSKTKEQLRKHLEKHFSLVISKDAMDKYVSRHKIKCIDYQENKVVGNDKLRKPIGSEWVRSDGMILVKAGEPSRWIYKQRYIYEQYYGEIPKDMMVVFLDGDRNNYDISNLKAVKTRDYLYARNKDLLSSDGEVTRTALMSGELYNKIKEIQNESNKIKKRN